MKPDQEKLARAVLWNQAVLRSEADTIRGLLAILVGSKLKSSAKQVEKDLTSELEKQAVKYYKDGLKDAELKDDCAGGDPHLN